MNVRWVRWFAALFFVAFVLAVIWPGIIPFNRFEPQIFGLPFVVFWIALWVLASFFVLLIVDRVEGKARERGE